MADSPSSPIVFAYLDEPPFCFPAEGGTAGGSDVELVTAVLKALGIVSFETRLTSFAELLPGLVDGRWTITTPLFISPERLELVDFSHPVWALADGLMTRQADSARLTSYEALARDGRSRLAVVSDQVQEQTGLKAGILDDRILRVATQEDAVDLVRSGRADAYASVAMAHRGYLALHPDPKLAVVTVGAAMPARGAFAFAKSAAGFRRRFDEALRSQLGSAWHRSMMARYGFSPDDLTLDHVAFGR
ncbi:transporter substrate-binding domain-containing protein [Bosea sp. LjRoot9]|uniref:transporter substrate-binding domain-containing protein n=1 Tax=Bosea sp. LjRoot9 TaxID=3342341 RepID=UPI003ECCA5EC